jgi:hypothetical protein
MSSCCCCLFFPQVHENDDYAYRTEGGWEREGMLDGDGDAGSIEMTACGDGVDSISLSRSSSAPVGGAIDDGGDLKWNPFATPSDLTAAMDLACSAGDDQQLRKLLQAGVHADSVCDDDGEPALHRAAAEGVCMLIGVCCLHAQPLTHASAISGNMEVVALLLSHNASPQSVSTETGDTPLHAVAAACCSRGSRHSGSGSGSTTANVTVAEQDCVQVTIAFQLLQLGAHVNAKNMDGSTPLHMVRLNTYSGC